jgi:hypothetical protein
VYTVKPGFVMFRDDVKCILLFLEHLNIMLFLLSYKATIMHFLVSQKALFITLPTSGLLAFLRCDMVPSLAMSNWFLMMPSITTKFQYVNSPFFIFPSCSLHVSAPMDHPQVRYTIRCFQGLFFLQRIHWRNFIL